MKTGVNTVSLLIEVGKVIRSRMERELPYSFSQCETLRVLHQEKSPTMRTVADYFKIAPPSATAIVSALVEADLVKRSENPADRRAVHLRLTDRGTGVLRTVTTRKKKIVAEILSVLPERDRKALDAILQKILTGIES
jgi:DNA-binding MarR family transcriptional regulator